MTRDLRQLTVATAGTLAVLMASVALAAHAQKDPAHAATSEAHAGKAWLGCRIGPVPTPVDKQLGLGGKGAIILNVAVDSPADKAGLERYDVVVAIGDQTVASPDALIRSIGKRAPGAVVDLSLMRKGELTKVKVTLAAPTPSGSETYKYDELPDAYVDDRVGVRGRILKKGPKGWEIEDLGDVTGRLDLDEFLVPGRRHGRLWLDRDRGKVTKFHARVTRDGKTIEVVGDGDGKITVTRSPGRDGSDVSVKSYESPLKLKAEDPEAYGIFREATDGQRRTVRLPKPPMARPQDKGYVERYRDWLERLYENLPSFDDRDLTELYRQKRDAWSKHLDAWSKQLHEELEQAKRDLLKDLEAEFDKRLKDMGGEGSETADPPGAAQQHVPALRFDIAADGKVTVHITKPQGAVTMEFKDMDDLRAKRPDLHARCMELQQP